MRKRFAQPVFPAFIAAIWCLFSLPGCDESIFYHASRLLPDNEWHRKDTLCFYLDTLSKDYKHLIPQIGIRTTDQYPYRSIWMAVEGQFARPDTAFCDTIECILTDSVNRPTGEGIHLYQHLMPLTPLSLKKGQSGQIRIRHLMIRETLPGIHDAGILLREE